MASSTSMPSNRTRLRRGRHPVGGRGPAEGEGHDPARGTAPAGPVAQRHDEARPAALVDRRLGPHGAAHGGRQLGHDGQSEPRSHPPAGPPVGLVEALEHPRQVARRRCRDRRRSTVITPAPDPGSSVSVTVTRSCGRTSIAFSSRLARSWASRSGSAARERGGASATADGPQRTRDRWRSQPGLGGGRPEPLGRRRDTTSAASVGRMEIDICRASSLVRSSRSPTRRSSRRDSAMITSAACPSSSIAPSWIASAKPRMDVERGAQVVRHREQEMPFPGAAVLEALRHVVDGAGQRGELGVVAVSDGHPAGELARRDAAGHLHRLHQRTGHAAAHLPRHRPPPRAAPRRRRR